jgi:hypothetical protein
MVKHLHRAIERLKKRRCGTGNSGFDRRTQLYLDLNILPKKIKFLREAKIFTDFNGLGTYRVSTTGYQFYKNDILTYNKNSEVYCKENVLYRVGLLPIFDWIKNGTVEVLK